MKRREFITLLGGAAAAWPLGARAQQAAKLPTIGFLVTGTPSTHGQWFSALVQRLRELGWIEGRTIAIEYRWAEGREERVAGMVAELVQLNVNIIVTNATTAGLAAKQATSSIPIVLPASADPVGTGLVASLARPGGNVTGLSIQATDLAAKRVELLREVVAGLRRLAILANVATPATALEMSEIKAAAQALRLCCLVPPGFAVVSTVCEERQTVITVRSIASVGACPSCGAVSRRVHSRYRRRAADLPLAGRSVQLLVVARRFRCDGVLSAGRYSPSASRMEFWRPRRGGQLGWTASSIILDWRLGVDRRRASPGG